MAALALTDLSEHRVMNMGWGGDVNSDVGHFSSLGGMWWFTGTYTAILVVHYNIRWYTSLQLHRLIPRALMGKVISLYSWYTTKWIWLPI